MRAGDIVQQGDLLFSLDDRDLRLERLKWASQKLQSKREYSEAVAKYDRARAKILSAQMEQAEAEIALLDEEIKRTRVTAPFDSFVVTGDLSQALGSPVERGDIMFELAPLNSYRVILEVDERGDVEKVPAKTPERGMKRGDLSRSDERLDRGHRKSELGAIGPVLGFGFNEVTAKAGWGAMNKANWQAQIDIYAGLKQFKGDVPTVGDVMTETILNNTADVRAKVG